MHLNQQQGFSLPETLLALLLFAMSLSALLQYQRVLSQGFFLQWQQREAWRYAAQRFEGHVIKGWQTELKKQSGPDGCQFITAEVISPMGRKARLTTLRCEE